MLLWPAPMRLPKRILVGLLALCVGSLARAADPRCANVKAYPRDTVLVLNVEGQLTICRGGEVQNDVVTHRPVWLELQPDSDESVYTFRIAERDAEPTVSGLATWHERAAALARALASLTEAEGTVAEMSPLASGDPRQRAVTTARALYLGLATPRFHAAVHDVAGGVDELPTIAASVLRWCTHLAAEKGLGAKHAATLSATCGSDALDEGKLHTEVEVLLAAVRIYHARRAVARDALVKAGAALDDSALQREAERALDAAREAALAVVADGERLRPAATLLARDATVLREVIHSTGVLRPGVPVMLARYGRAGNGILRIDVRPKNIIVAGVKEAGADTHTLTFRFTIVDWHVVDLEAGLGITGGLPNVPSLVTSNGANVVRSHPGDKFVALALVELEPLRFAWPDKPLAGLLRLPVLAVPLSENPIDHFFIGAGLGWTGVGSVTIGPYIVKELSLRPGNSVGETLPSTSSFSSITHPEFHVGYYVSASVDLFGLFRLFVPEHLKSIDATTGKEL
jgi:hypothetical protein